MNSKRKEVFTDHVLKRLYPPAQDNDVGDDNVQRSKAEPSLQLQTPVTKEKSASTSSKTYGVYLPPEIQQQMRAVAAGATVDGKDVKFEDDVESSAESEDNEPVPKRRRRKQRKYKLQPSGDTTKTCNEESKNISSNLGAKQIPSNSNNSQTLTKNQKRKLRKKRKRMGADKPDGRDPSEFTFEPTEEFIDSSKPSDGDLGHNKEVICQDVKNFIQSIWDMYIREEVLNECSHHGLQKGTLDTFLVLIEYLEMETLKSMQQWKELLVLRDRERADHQVQLLTKELANEQSRIMEHLTEYWFNDIIKASSST